jgi:hypothetical protein
MRKSNTNHTGECDIFKEFPDKKIVIDTKCSWSPETFMNAGQMFFTRPKEIFTELWDADEFHLKYCLVDAPPHLVQEKGQC